MTHHYNSKYIETKLDKTLSGLHNLRLELEKTVRTAEGQIHALITLLDLIEKLDDRYRSHVATEELVGK